MKSRKQNARNESNIKKATTTFEKSPWKWRNHWTANGETLALDQCCCLATPFQIPRTVAHQRWPHETEQSHLFKKYNIPSAHTHTLTHIHSHTYTNMHIHDDGKGCSSEVTMLLVVVVRYRLRTPTKPNGNGSNSRRPNRRNNTRVMVKFFGLRKDPSQEKKTDSKKMKMWEIF